MIEVESAVTPARAAASPRGDAAPADESIVERARCRCTHTLFIVRMSGIEIKCGSCRTTTLYSWRKVLTMMLAAEMARLE